MKRLFALLFTFVLILAGCGAKSTAGEKTIGIALPTSLAQRWTQDGDYLVQLLEEKGYKTILQNAQDDPQVQVTQIENMITSGVDALIIAPSDGTALEEPLKMAKEQNIPVIAYDRLLMNTDAVSDYVTFDNYKVGELQGQYIVDKLDLENQPGPFNIEIFAGDPGDNNATVFYEGAMSVLQPYIDSGKLVVPSGQTKFDDVATTRWDGQIAQTRMDDLLTANYSDKKVDAVLAPNDDVATGVISSLKSAGYTKLPITTGQDANINSIKSIKAGEQTMTIFKDTKVLAEQAVKMVDDILSGKTPEVNDTTSYDNGVFVVPTYLVEPVAVDITNYKEVVIDSGYYTEDQIS